MSGAEDVAELGGRKENATNGSPRKAPRIHFFSRSMYKPSATPCAAQARPPTRARSSLCSPNHPPSRPPYSPCPFFFFLVSVFLSVRTGMARSRSAPFPPFLPPSIPPSLSFSLSSPILFRVAAARFFLTRFAFFPMRRSPLGDALLVLALSVLLPLCLFLSSLSLSLFLSPFASFSSMFCFCFVIVSSCHRVCRRRSLSSGPFFLPPLPACSSPLAACFPLRCSCRRPFPFPSLSPHLVSRRVAKVAPAPKRAPSLHLTPQNAPTLSRQLLSLTAQAASATRTSPLVLPLLSFLCHSLHPSLPATHPSLPHCSPLLRRPAPHPDRPLSGPTDRPTDRSAGPAPRGPGRPLTLLSLLSPHFVARAALCAKDKRKNEEPKARPGHKRKGARRVRQRRLRGASRTKPPAHLPSSLPATPTRRSPSRASRNAKKTASYTSSAFFGRWNGE